MLRAGQLLPPEGLSTLRFDAGRFPPTPAACYRASWQLPGPDSHRLAATSLHADHLNSINSFKQGAHAAGHKKLPLVLLRRFVTFECFESFAVVTGSGFGLPPAAPVRPVQHVTDRGASNEDEFAVEASDLVAAQWDERFSVADGAPFAASAARVATRNAAAAMARVMWAYQAS
jgi:hypothetical protein